GGGLGREQQPEAAVVGQIDRLAGPHLHRRGIEAAKERYRLRPREVQATRIEAHALAIGADGGWHAVVEPRDISLGTAGNARPHFLRDAILFEKNSTGSTDVVNTEPARSGIHRANRAAGVHRVHREVDLFRFTDPEL